MDASEKAFDNFQQPLIWKALNNLLLKQRYLNTIKIMMINPQPTICLMVTS